MFTTYKKGEEIGLTCFPCMGVEKMNSNERFEKGLGLGIVQGLERHQCICKFGPPKLPSMDGYFLSNLQFKSQKFLPCAVGSTKAINAALEGRALSSQLMELD
jgi:hypothetical protein